MIIYKATNKLNNKKYIGLTTKTLEERKRTHAFGAKNGTTYFNRAIREYGVEGFNWEEIDTADTIEELRSKEEEWILYYDTFDNKDKGYNTSSGGQYFKITEAEKIRRSERARGENNPMYGVPSPMKGKKFSKSHRRKMSESGKKVDRVWLRGETNPSARPVIDLTTLEVYGTIKEASEALSISVDSIRYSFQKNEYVKGHLFQIYEEDREYLKVEKGSTHNKKVLNVTTGTSYDSISEASREEGCARKGIRETCNGLREEYKGFKWEYI